MAIDQILRLAPSISGPIEPVVSSTKPTSTMGLAEAMLETEDIRITPRIRVLTSRASMILPYECPTMRMIFLFRDGRGPGLRLTVGGLAAACFVAGHVKI